MNKTDLLTLWAYNSWATEQILAAAARLPAAALSQTVYSGHGSLFGTLLHLVDTEYGWRALAEAGREVPVLTEQDIPDLGGLIARARSEAAAWRAYLEALSDADVAGMLRYAVEGQPRERVRWHVLVHVVNHGTYHRGEAAAALTALGQSPGELDFLTFMRR